MSWLLTYSSNITLSLPSYTGSALKRVLNFCNGYLSLLYFCFCLYDTVCFSAQSASCAVSALEGSPNFKYLIDKR